MGLALCDHFDIMNASDLQARIVSLMRAAGATTDAQVRLGIGGSPSCDSDSTGLWQRLDDSDLLMQRNSELNSALARGDAHAAVTACEMAQMVFDESADEGSLNIAGARELVRGGATISVGTFVATFALRP